MAALRYWREIAGAGLLILCAFLWLSVKAESARADKWKERAAAEKLAHQGTVSNYRQQREIAAAQDKANAARVERDQERVTKEVSSDYQERIADLHARYDSLRSAAAETDSGGGRGTGVPGLPNPADGSDDASPEDGLPSEDALIATEQAMQLEALQDWVRAQQGVER